MSLDSKIQKKDIIVAEVSVIRDQIEHTPAWEKHQLIHHDAKLNVQIEQRESDLTGRIGFDGMRQFRAINSQTQSHDGLNQEQRAKQAENLGWQGEVQLNAQRESADKSGAKMYGQNTNAVSNLYNATTNMLNSANVSANCACGQDFSKEAHNALGAMQNNDLTKPSYKSDPHTGGGYSGSGSFGSSQPTYSGSNQANYR